MPYSSVQYFRHACQNIVDNKEAKALNWAANRAKQGLLASGLGSQISSEELRTRSLYILTNMTHWRGDVAKETRAIFKRISREEIDYAKRPKS